MKHYTNILVVSRWLLRYRGQHLVFFFPPWTITMHRLLPLFLVSSLDAGKYRIVLSLFSSSSSSSSSTLPARSLRGDAPVDSDNDVLCAFRSFVLNLISGSGLRERRFFRWHVLDCACSRVIQAGQFTLWLASPDVGHAAYLPGAIKPGSFDCAAVWTRDHDDNWFPKS